MALTEEQVLMIEEALKNSLRNKMNNYKPETKCMPFHTRLLGKDRLALFSFIHSLNTNFGTTIFEPVALALAKNKHKSALKQQVAGNVISYEAQIVIQEIMDKLTTGFCSPNKELEIEAIREVCQKGKMVKVKPTKIDLKIIDNNDYTYLIDIKTVKPNKGNFKEFKRTLLEWVAVTLANNPEQKVNTLIAIPYNPYEPHPYNRWTMVGMIDIKNELLVAEEFWEFLGGQNSYVEILKVFEQVGIEMRGEIDHYFKKFDKVRD
jgi:hypothetical protein